MLEIKKGYKDTQLGEIPIEWEVKELGQVTTVVSGGTPRKDIIEYWNNGDILWATPTDITKNRSKYIKNTNLKISEKGLNDSSANILPKGTVLMTSRATIGEKSINVEPMATNQGFKSFICQQELFNEYLYYYIDLLKPIFIRKASGSTFLEISKKTTEEQTIAVPPIEEQKKIADILSTVDTHIEQTNQLIEKTKELKKGLMQQLLTRGIVHKRYKESKCGTIPENWSISNVGYICDYRREKINPLKSERKKYIALENIEQGSGRIKGYLYSDESSSMKSVFKKGDTLFNKLRPYLNKYWYATFDGVCATELLPITTKNNTDSLFLYYCLQQERVLGYVTQRTFGTKMPRTSWKELKEIEIPIPPVKEQKKIAEILSSVDQNIEGYREEKAKYEALKKGLMQQLLTGKRRVKV